MNVFSLYRFTELTLNIHVLSCVYIVISQSCPSSSDPIGCSLPDSSVRGISQARYQSGLPFPTPGDLSHPGIKSVSLAWQADSLPLCHLGSLYVYYTSIKLSYKILWTTYDYNGLHYFLSRTGQQLLPISLESVLPSFWCSLALYVSNS